VFLVVWVDHDLQEADLIPLRGTSGAEENVSFADLEPFSGTVPLEST
jgi:hypothetical protein